MSPDDRLRRWRLVLGDAATASLEVDLDGFDTGRDKALGALYDGERSAGLGGSSPRVARWLGDIRTYFPSTIVEVLQRDAVERLGLHQLLLEPELLESVQPDVHLVATLVALQGAIPEASRATARAVIQAVVDELRAKLAEPMERAVTGALSRAHRTSRPRPADIDWLATIRANLRHYQPEARTVIPERLVGHARRRPTVERDVVIAMDQSGSMAASVVYAGVFAAVMASLPTLRTRLVAFDTAVVDLTEVIEDPVDVLFGIQLGGGTDIAGAVAYCQSRIERPDDTIFVLISDLYEGGVRDELLARTRDLLASGVQVVVLLALSDDGAPAYDAELGAEMAALGAPAFACTPDRFPDLMAAAIERRDVGAWWAAANPTPTPLVTPPEDPAAVDDDADAEVAPDPSETTDPEP